MYFSFPSTGKERMEPTNESMQLDDGATIDLLVMRPHAPPRGAVILLSPIFGFDSDFVAIAAEWADVGYVALAPDYYHRAGASVFTRDKDGFRSAIARWKRWDVIEALADLRAVAHRARMHATARPLGVVGYCAGGELAARAASDEVGDAPAIFNAARLDRLALELAQVHRPLALHFGGADKMVPPEQADIVRNAVAGNPHIELSIHDGADHGYTFAHEPAYHATAARLSFESALTMLERVRGAAAAGAAA
jgi:carboxymethylenebutenolidase